ncbi:MAG: hypothetical protein M3O46_19835 [Myxococcota bacterium]|nr:hypothetical protein [Myxococcota bacterium]
MTGKTPCPTCVAMAEREITSQPPERAVELAHILGMVVAIEIVGGRSPEEARAYSSVLLCAEHANDLFLSAGYLVEAFKSAGAS